MSGDSVTSSPPPAPDPLAATIARILAGIDLTSPADEPAPEQKR